MDHLFEEKNLRKARILVAPLDWGLGHATRCIPLIRRLLDDGADVWLAGEGAQKELLSTEFPGLPFLDLPGYRVEYSRSAAALPWKLMQQSRRLMRSIKQEQLWLQQVQQQHHFDIIISDNRYGLHHPGIHCIIMTHQLAIQVPGSRLIERLIAKKNYRYLEKFNECWVPDQQAAPGLAGSLSHPARMPSIPVKYIGPMSRFEKKEVKPIQGQLLFILSGPEPQRTILEDIIINQVAHYPGTAIIVRGLPGDQNIIPSTNMIRFFNHLDASSLGKAMQESEFVISRSGYSTIMDLAQLNCRGILIPTPGQTEQQYLADFLAEQKFAPSFAQKNFDLTTALKIARAFDYQSPVIPG